MCSLKLPKTVIEVIGIARRNSLWRGSNVLVTKKKTLVAWNKVCRPKDKGGFGVINYSECGPALKTSPQILHCC